MLPNKLKQQVEELPYLVPVFHHDTNHQGTTLTLRTAVTNKTCIEFHYLDVKQRLSHRIIDPLGLVYWGAKWTLIAYCQLRSDYREFRLDRIQSIAPLAKTFDTHPQKNLAHYIELVKAKYQTHDDKPANN